MTAVTGSTRTVAERLRKLADEATSSSSQAEVASELLAIARSLGANNTDGDTIKVHKGHIADDVPVQRASKRHKKAPKEFDFSRYRTRYVALELMYIGTTYQGFARQDSTDNTIEGQLFAALRRTKLIPEDAEISSLSYSRCGRTDKGVSALGQVIALKLRSSARVPEQSPASKHDSSDPVRNTSTQHNPHISSQPTAASISNHHNPIAGVQHNPSHVQADSVSSQVPTEAPPQSDAAGLQDQEEAGLPAVDQELDYPRIINRALPPDIRILGWTPVPPTFNARFSAVYREYKYFIVDRDGALDIPAMQQAAQHFVGEHDFRNLCKPDILAVRSFIRRIQSFTLEPWGVHSDIPHPYAAWHVSSQPGTASHVAPPPVQNLQPASEEMCHTADGGSTHSRDHSQVYAFTVRGTAFLWHQVRCMVAVLMMVGQRLEQPDVVKRLLDVQAMPCKPCYNMAPEEPLLLYACGFEGLSFIRANNLAGELSSHVRDMSDKHLVAASLCSAVAARLAADAARCDTESTKTTDNNSTKNAADTGIRQTVKQKGPAHIPMLKRAVEMSINERMRKAGITELGQKKGGGLVSAMDCDGD